MSVPRRPLLAEETYEVLREALITNRLTPGQHLNIAQLAEELSVSSTPIRHALVRLEADGFVTRTPYKGYIASPMLDRGTVAEIYEARLLIETELAATAAGRATEEDADFLAQVAAMDPLAQWGDDDDEPHRDATVTCDAVLHRRIAEIAGNTTLVEILGGLNKKIATHRNFRVQQLQEGRDWDPGPATDATKKEHAAIVKAIRQGDGEAARAAMRTHIENASQRDIDSVNSGPSA